MPFALTGGAPRMKVVGDGAIALDHPKSVAGYALLMNALGTRDLDFINGLIQLGNATAQKNEPSES